MHSLVAPVAFGQLWDSRGCKSTTIHPLQSLSAPLPGSETGPCQCSLLWQTHPLHLHGTPYKAPWDKVSFCLFFFLTFIFLSQYFHPGAACSLFSVTIHTNVCLLKASSVLLLKQPSQCPFAVTPRLDTECMFPFSLAEGTQNITTMVYVWNQIPHSTDSRKTCSIWPSDNNLFSRNRGITQTCRTAVTQITVVLDTEVSHLISGSSLCRSLTLALGRPSQVEAQTILVQQSRQSLHRASTTSSS